MMRLEGSVATHVGNVRESNQDRAHFGGYLAVVADGMGGHQGGEMAATIAVNEFLDVAGPVVPGGLVELVEDANRAIFERAADPELRGMGTTLVALTLRPTEEKISVVNVGDSRAYFLRDETMAQLTLDHSLVEDLVRQNRLTPDEALTHPQRNILTRALGIASEVEVDRFLIPTKIGDRFLLCSDGLFNEVSEDEILRILCEYPDPALAADTLVSAALAGAGRDNITVAVVDVLGGGDIPKAPSGPQTLQMPIVEVDAADPTIVESETAADGDYSSGGGSAQAFYSGTGAVGLAEPEVDPELDDFGESPMFLPRAVDTQDVPATAIGAGRLPTVLLAMGLVALLVAAGYYLAGYWSDRTWFVAPATPGADGLAVYNGQPDGFLWVEAEMGEEIGVDLAQLSPEARTAIGSGETFGSLDEALEFVTDNTVRLAPIDDGLTTTDGESDGATADEGESGSADTEATNPIGAEPSVSAPAAKADAGS